MLFFDNINDRLVKSAAKGDLEKVKYYLTQPKTNINYIYRPGMLIYDKYTALYKALENNHPEVAHFLVDKGAQLIDIAYYRTYEHALTTAFFCCANTSLLKAILSRAPNLNPQDRCIFLIDRLANIPNVEFRNSFFSLLFYEALLRNNQSVMKQILKQESRLLISPMGLKAYLRDRTLDQKQKDDCQLAIKFLLNSNRINSVNADNLLHVITAESLASTPRNSNVRA